MKKLLLLALAVIMAAAACSFACAEGAEEANPSELLDLWDYSGENPVWVASAVPAFSGAVMVPPAALSAAGNLKVSDGVNVWEVQIIVPDETGLLALVLYDQADIPARYNPWMLMALGESVPASSCRVRFTDGTGEKADCAVLSAEDYTWQGRRCLLLSLAEDVPLGSPVLTGDGRLAGIVVAGWAEGVNRVLALPPEEIAASLTATVSLVNNLPDMNEAPEGLTVTLQKNAALIDWTDMPLPEAAEGSQVFMVLMDTGNNYLSYYAADMESRVISALLTPGRVYIAGPVVSEGRPDRLPQTYATIAVPPAEQLTEYGFRPVLTAIAEAPEAGLQDGEAPVPVTEVTEELLRSGRAYFYSHSVYEVTETVQGKSLLISLTSPDGVNYRHESSWIYAPEYMAEDIWYLSLQETGLTASLDANGYPAGVYRMAFYVDGDLADEFEFELK